MIIAFLSGGLGNQMFQFAAAKALALKTKQTLKLDLSFYQLYSLNRQFELDKVFKYKFDIVTNRDLKTILGYKVFFHRSPIFRKVCKKIGTGKNWLVEPHFHFYADFFNGAGNCLIEGDWQSEKYFKDFTEIIKDAFTFNLESFADYGLLRRMKESNSVAIHLRRGDYVTNKHTFSWHGICGKEYYVRAIDFLRQKFRGLKFFVFPVLKTFFGFFKRESAFFNTSQQVFFHQNSFARKDVTNGIGGLGTYLQPIQSPVEI
ncbi:MAG: hypothetical protein PWQ65_1298 [Bacteroidota bacterium]|nr:hypothetical protein [Bacteroidota bacterium]